MLDSPLICSGLHCDITIQPLTKLTLYPIISIRTTQYQRAIKQCSDWSASILGQADVTFHDMLLGS